MATALENKNSHLVAVVRDLEAVQNSLKAHISDLEAKIGSIQTEKESILEDKSRLEDRVKSLSLSFAQSSDEIAALQASKSDLQQVVSHLNQSLIAHAQNEGLLAEKLMNMKQELLEVTSELKFEVLKINKVINREAKVSFKRSEQGEFTFEIDQKSRKKTYRVDHIEEVSPDPGNPRRFTLRLSVIVTQNGDLKIFESPQAQKLVEAIRRFIAKLSPSIVV